MVSDKYNYDDEKSYPNKMDGLFYKGKTPIQNEPFTLKDICEGAIRAFSHFIRPEYITAFVFVFTNSIKATCLICRIKRRTFYYHIQCLKKICPKRRKPS